MDMQIVYIDPRQLMPYDRNARKHAPKDIEAIKASVREFGFSDPIGIWGDDNVIVEGHGRQIAAIELGLERVPCIRLDHMSDEQRRAYALAHNKTAELSAWDFGKLEEELAGLAIDGFEMDVFGFGDSYEDEDAAREGFSIDDAGHDDEYNAEPKKETKVRLGDIYQLGAHRLMCGDSTDDKDVKALMGGAAGGLAPYGSSLQRCVYWQDGRCAYD